MSSSSDSPPERVLQVIAKIKMPVGGNSRHAGRVPGVVCSKGSILRLPFDTNDACEQLELFGKLVARMAKSAQSGHKDGAYRWVHASALHWGLPRERTPRGY